jgi:hypothetical protein
VQGAFPASISVTLETSMARDLLLWLFGVPLSVIVLLHLFGVLHW